MSKRKPKTTTTAIVKQDDTQEYWKARCLRAEEMVSKYQEAFSMLISPFAEFMRNKIDEMVSSAVDDAISEIEVESYVRR